MTFEFPFVKTLGPQSSFLSIRLRLIPQLVHIIFFPLRLHPHTCTKSDNLHIVCSCMLICVSLLYSISSSDLSATGHQACVSFTLENRQNTETGGASICMHVHPTGRGGGRRALCGVTAETGASMCAFECDSAHIPGITTVDVRGV